VSSQHAIAPIDDEAKEAKPFQWPESEPVKLIGRNGQNGDPDTIILNPELCGHVMEMRLVGSNTQIKEACGHQLIPPKIILISQQVTIFASMTSALDLDSRRA
jgi:hypothetical protein